MTTPLHRNCRRHRGRRRRIAGVVGGTDAATAVRVGNSSATAFNFMPLELGIKEGYFAKNGLDVQVIGLPKYGVPRCPHHV